MVVGSTGLPWRRTCLAFRPRPRRHLWSCYFSPRSIAPGRVRAQRPQAMLPLAAAGFSSPLATLPTPPHPGGKARGRASAPVQTPGLGSADSSVFHPRSSPRPRSESPRPPIPQRLPFRVRRRPTAPTGSQRTAAASALELRALARLRRAFQQAGGRHKRRLRSGKGAPCARQRPRGDPL